MNFESNKSSTELSISPKVIALVDLDCFYVQVLQRKAWGKHWNRESSPPTVVLQYTGG